MRSFRRIPTNRLGMAVLIVLFALASSSWGSGVAPRNSSHQSSPAHITVRQIKILGGKDSVEIEVETSDPVTPQTQLLTGPDRLVLDFPNAVPGNDLRSQSIYVGQVKDIRAGLFRPRPPITRLVVDLESPESYQVFPAGRTVMIKMTTGSRSGTSVAVDIWREPAVSSPVTSPGVQARAPDELSKNDPPKNDPPKNDPPKPSLEVEFVNGLLTIKADRVTLGEILTAVQQRTGAKISSAPGADQEKVVCDLGPAPAQDVLAHLFNGSKFNFLILNAAGDPKKLDRVILTPRGSETSAAPLLPVPSADPAPEQAVAGPEQGPPAQVQQYPPPSPELNSPPPEPDAPNQ